MPQSAGPDSASSRDPQMKREALFAGPVPRTPATQVVVVTHSRALLEFLDTVPIADAGPAAGAVEIELYKERGETRVAGRRLLTTPPSDPDRR